MTITEVKNHLIGKLHGSTLSKVRNIEHALERAANNLLANIKPVDSEREAALSSLIYDDIYNYALPSDYGSIIDLRPQETRSHLELAGRRYAAPFDLQKSLARKTISIEGREGTKFIRINWRTRSPILIDGMGSLTAQGTWAAVGTASGLRIQTLYRITGNSSLEFDLAASGDGVSFAKTTAIDLEDEDEQADVFVWVYLPTSTDVTRLTSATVRWGSSSTVYWESAASTTQADGSAFRVGWNLLKFAWSGATETGTVDATVIDYFRIVFATTGAIANIKLDSAVFAVGKNFDLKYYSAYAFKNTSGTYIIRPTSDDDEVIFSGTALQCFLEEATIECAGQIEGEDSAFDINQAEKRLHGDAGSPDRIQRIGLYGKYRAEYPSQVQVPVRSWSTVRSPNFRYR